MKKMVNNKRLKYFKLKTFIFLYKFFEKKIKQIIYKFISFIFIIINTKKIFKKKIKNF